MDLTSKDPAVYPLSLLISAALSTKATKADRAEMADMLDYVRARASSPAKRSASCPTGTLL